jgi:hypothetical protein
MGRENPFVCGGAIKFPQLYYEQPAPTHEAIDLLRKGACVSVVGPPRIGKSSLLNYLNRRLEHGGGDGEASGGPRYCCVLIDCSSLANETPERCVYSIHSDLALHADDLGCGEVARPSSGSSDYLWDLRLALRGLRSRGFRTVFLFDDFESLGENAALDKVFFDRLSAVNAKEDALYVTASSQNLPEITYARAESKTSRFFRLFTGVTLGLLTDTSATHLLTEFAQHGGVAFPDALTSTLAELAGPHPLLLQIAGYHAFEQLGAAATADADPTTSALDSVRQRFFEHAKGVWMDLWKHAVPEEDARYYLALLAVKQGASAEIVGRLTRACVVREASGRLVPVSAGFRRFVAQQHVPPLIQAWPIVLDPREQQVLLWDQEIKLGPSAFRLLECLVEHPDHLVTYEQITNQVRREDVVRNASDRDWLKPVVGELREKLATERDRVQVKDGVGYRFVPATD